MSCIVVQSLSCVWLFPTPWIAAHQTSLSFTISKSSLKLMSIELVMPSSHLTLCHPLLLLSSVFPSIRVFLVSQLFASYGQNIGASASLSVSSVAQSRPTLCDPMDCSTPGFLVRRQLLELAQTHVHRVSDAILCRPLLLLPSVSPSFRVFSSESVLSIMWRKYWSFSFSISPSSEYSGLNIPMNIPLGWTGWICLKSKGLLRVFSNTVRKFKSINSLPLSLLYGPALTYMFLVSYKENLCISLPYLILNHDSLWKLKFFFFHYIFLNVFFCQPLIFIALLGKFLLCYILL